VAPAVEHRLHASKRSLRASRLDPDRLGLEDEVVPDDAVESFLLSPALRPVRLAVDQPDALLPVSGDAAEGLSRLVDAAYERRSVAIRSNLHPAGFDELMPKTLATATVDRLLHHAHLYMTDGDSVRLAQATAGVGVVPLTGPVPSRAPSRRRGLPSGSVVNSTEVSRIDND
jgi:hypothetical protein